MNYLFKQLLPVLSSFVLLSATPSARACTCIGQDKQTTVTELRSSDIVVRGKIIAAADFVYYDTVGYSLSGLKFDPKEAGLLIRRYKIFTMRVDQRFKVPGGTPDTISIITGLGSGDCGFEFETGKDYIVYANSWKEKKLAVKQRKRKTRHRIEEISISGKFHTSICRMTQESNQQELDNLKKLTQF